MGIRKDRAAAAASLPMKSARATTSSAAAETTTRATAVPSWKPDEMGPAAVAEGPHSGYTRDPSGVRPLATITV